MTTTSKLVHEPGKVAGVVVRFGGIDYIVPPLNAIGLQRCEEKIERVQSEHTLKLSEKLDLVCDVALTALRRNYPELTIDFLKEWIDLRNMLDVFNAVLGVSGFENTPGEAAASA